MKTQLKVMMVVIGLAALMSACDGEAPNSSIGPDEQLIVDPPFFGGGCVLKVISGAEITTVTTGEKEMSVQGGEVVNESMRAFLIRRLQKTAYNMKNSCVPANYGEGFSASPVATADHTSTGTNVQEAGVGEWDSMQTDGTYLYNIVGNQLRISRIYPVAEAKPLAQLAFDGNVQNIALSEKTLAVISEVYLPQSTQTEMSVAMKSPTHIQLTLLDVTNPASPKVRHQRLFAGSWISGRHHDGQLYLVLKSGISVAPETLKISLPSCGADGKPADSRTWEATLAAELEKQSDIIRKMDFVSHITDDVNVSDTAQFYDNPEVIKGQFLRVIRVAIADAGAQKVMITGGGSIVYASKKSIYVADKTVGGLSTAIHRFSTSERLAFAGTVEADGAVLNSFSMGEDDGVLRVATTIGFNTSNTIHTFRLESDTMALLGTLKGIAPTERIFAVRYIGKRGYVVTFRQTDPLFVVDFADPSAPKLLGELKIPGFSTYLHPLGDTHLIGVGMSDKNQPQISLFDVSDAGHPKEVAVSALGATQSAALSDHHAFTFDAATGLLALPSSNGYRVFRVSAEKGIEKVGESPASYYLNYYNGENRSVLMTDVVGSHLVTISNSGIQIRKTDAVLSVEKTFGL
jgi:hypothetical protein